MLNVAVFSIALFLFAPTTNAAVIISEIMYDPAGNDAGSGSSSASREWIEIKTMGILRIDVSSLKFRENDTRPRSRAQARECRPFPRPVVTQSLQVATRDF